MKIKEVKAKTIITKSNLPDAGYVVNPYTGCIFGCIYCYASFMSRFVGESFDSWGEYVYVKTNAVELFEKEIKKLNPKPGRSSILLSSVTDPYQGMEAKYKLTRGVLDVLAREKYNGGVGILTKSPLVMRDIDVIKRIPKIEVGMTVTTTDDFTSRFAEVRAPQASKRIEALKKLNEEGISTYAFIGPLLPHFRYHPEKLEEVFSSIADAGVKSVFVEHINLKNYIRNRLLKILDKEPEEVRKTYMEASTEKHKKILDEMVAKMIKKYGLELCMEGVIRH